MVKILDHSYLHANNIFLLENNISFRAITDIAAFLQKEAEFNPDCLNLFANLKMYRSKTRIILNGVFKESYKERLENIIKNTIFSISADEVTDVSGLNYLAISVHFSNEESSPTAKLWGLIPLGTDCSAVKIYRILQEQLLSKYEQKTIAFITDGAPTFQGHLKGVKALIKKKIPDIITIHCLAHSTDLVAKKAFDCLDYDIASFLTEITTYFTKSTTNKAKFMELQKELGIEPYQLLKICKTRWLELFNAIRRINERWDSLSLYFEG